MRISVVLFDLGSTLLYSKDPWQPIFLEADQCLVASLQKGGISLSYEAFQAEFGGFLNSYYVQRGNGVYEKTATVALKEILTSRGIMEIGDDIISAALDAMYRVTQQNWYLEEDAIPTLRDLNQRRIRLGLISNTSDDNNAQQLIDRFHLRGYFECIVTSAGCGIRKPDPHIFNIALDHFDVQPQEIMMVGDTLEADILGANNLGLYSVWITRRSTSHEEGVISIQPQAAVSFLSEIPTLISELEADKKNTSIFH